MKIYQLLYLALLGISVISCNSSSPAAKTQENFDKTSLSLTLTLDKNAYTMNEAIKANLTLSKKPNTLMIINGRMALNISSAPASQRDVAFIVITPLGEKAGFKPKIHMDPPAEYNFMILNAVYSIQAEYELQEFYVLDEIGTYTIYAIYENQFDPPRGVPAWRSTAWKGLIESNTLQFEIK